MPSRSATTMLSSSAVLDANVLFPMRLCDTLLTLAEAGILAPRWTVSILDEMERNLVAQRRTTAERAHRRRLIMEATFPAATVTGFEPLIAAMPNDTGDRHVLATAVHAGAPVIVTQNLRHFPPDALALYAVVAQPADRFLLDRLAADPEAVTGAIHKQATTLTRPPQSAEQVLARLATEAPQFARAMTVVLRGDS